MSILNLKNRLNIQINGMNFDEKKKNLWIKKQNDLRKILNYLNYKNFEIYNDNIENYSYLKNFYQFYFLEYYINKNHSRNSFYKNFIASFYRNNLNCINEIKKKPLSVNILPLDQICKKFCQKEMFNIYLSFGNTKIKERLNFEDFSREKLIEVSGNLSYQQEYNKRISKIFIILIFINYINNIILIKETIMETPIIIKEKKFNSLNDIYNKIMESILLFFYDFYISSFNSNKTKSNYKQIKTLYRIFDEIYHQLKLLLYITNRLFPKRKNNKNTYGVGIFIKDFAKIPQSSKINNQINYQLKYYETASKIIENIILLYITEEEKRIEEEEKTCIFNIQSIKTQISDLYYKNKRSAQNYSLLKYNDKNPIELFLFSYDLMEKEILLEDKNSRDLHFIEIKFKEIFPKCNESNKAFIIKYITDQYNEKCIKFYNVLMMIKNIFANFINPKNQNNKYFDFYHYNRNFLIYILNCLYLYKNFKHPAKFTLELINYIYESLDESYNQLKLLLYIMNKLLQIEKNQNIIKIFIKPYPTLQNDNNVNDEFSIDKTIELPNSKKINYILAYYKISNQITSIFECLADQLLIN